MTTPRIMDTPTLAGKIANAAYAAGRVVKAAVKGQQITVSDEEVERRLSICRACEFFTGTNCSLCGCVARFKAKLKTESCPIGKGGFLSNWLYIVTMEVKAEEVAGI